MQPVCPTGAQHELRFGEQRAVAVEVGGGLRCYEVNGRPVLDGYGEHEEVTGARGQHLLPWPNRLADGRYRWEGADQELPLTEPERHNAIHGLLRWTNFSVQRAGEAELSMTQRLYPQPGWPFALEVSVTYRLDERGLSVRTGARNIGGRACPYGSGAHPYLTVGTAHVDEASLQLRATTVLDTDGRGLPTGEVPVAGERDFREPRRIGATKLDDAFTGLQRDADGLFRVRLKGPDGVTVALWQDDAYPYLEVFTGDTLPAAKRRTGLGVEPMTMPPNALASGRDVVRLEPGQSHTGTWGIEPFGE